jgi:hypothetical protein
VLVKRYAKTGTGEKLLVKMAAKTERLPISLKRRWEENANFIRNDAI